MAFQTISVNSWLIANQFVLERSWVILGQPPSGYTFKGPYSAYYTLSPAPNPPPETRRFYRDIQITTHLQYDRSLSGVWQIGDFVIKVRPAYTDRTQEHVTIDWVSKKKWTYFSVPKLVHVVDHGGMQAVVMTRVPGSTLRSVWPTLSEEEKNYYVQSTSKIYKELSQCSASYIGSVDGRLSTGISFYLRTDDDDKDPEQKNLIRQCKEIGMRCDSFMFTHPDMHMGNIIVRTDDEAKAAIQHALSQAEVPAPDEPLIAVIDWEQAEFVPLEWIATNAADGHNWSHIYPEIHRDFKKRVMKQMEIDGMPNLWAECDRLRNEVLKEVHAEHAKKFNQQN